MEAKAREASGQLKQKTQAILADHPGFCSFGFPGEPVTPK
jgi:hypothetical protein